MSFNAHKHQVAITGFKARLTECRLILEAMDSGMSEKELYVHLTNRIKEIERDIKITQGLVPKVRNGNDILRSEKDETL